MSNNKNNKIYTENIKEMDGRVIKFLNIVNRAPREIQTATDEFLTSIDKLKKNYVSNIVRSKRVENKYDDTKRYLAVCQREYDYFRRQDDYLSQIGPDDYHDQNYKLEKATLELAFRNCSLQMAERELELSREKLFRLGRKMEYSFKWTLVNHPDKRWAQIYCQDQSIMKPEARLKNPLPKPAPYAKVDLRKKNRRACCDTCGKNKKTNNGDIGKNSAANKLDTNELRGDRNSLAVPLCAETISKTRNVGNILPDVIILDKDEKTVDEGIGDINWTPSPTPSVSRGSCDSSTFTPPKSSELPTENELTWDVNMLPPPPPVLLEGINDYDIETTTDDTTENINRASIINFDRMWNLPDGIPTDETLLDMDSLPPPPQELLESAFSSQKTVVDDDTEDKTSEYISKDTCDVDGKNTDDVTHDLCSCCINEENSPLDEDFNVNMISDTVNNNVDNLTSKIPVQDEDSPPSEEILLDGNRNRTNSIEKQTCDNIVSNNTTETSLKDEHGGCNSRSSERRHHVYQDMYLDNRKLERTKKKGKLKFLTKMFHGPWEGWEEGS